MENQADLSKQNGTQIINTVRQYIQEELYEAKYFKILADKSRDISKKEQLFIYFRYTHKGKTVEHFTGYTHASELNAPALEYIFERISEFKLDLSNCVSQCYDGASVMSGHNAGVHVLIQEKCKQAVYVHCCTHRLNLVLVVLLSKFQLLKTFLPSSKPFKSFCLHQRLMRSLLQSKKFRSQT